MTDQESKRLIALIEENAAKMKASKEYAWEFLISAGIYTEDDRKKSEEEQKRKEGMK